MTKFVYRVYDWQHVAKFLENVLKAEQTTASPQTQPAL